MTYRGLALLVVPGLLVGAALVVRTSEARADPALVGESLAWLASDPRDVAAGGATVVDAPGPGGMARQPAALGHARRLEWNLVLARERFPFEDSSQWSLGVVVPLQALDSRVPSLAIHHRRLRSDARFDLPSIGGAARVELGYEADLTTLAAGWGFGAPVGAARGTRWSIGAALHVLEAGGELRSEVDAGGSASPVEVVPGLEDLLFAGTLGMTGRWSRPLADDAHVELRAGGAWRRAGEESDRLSATVRLVEVGTSLLDALPLDEALGRGPLMVEEVAAGVGVELDLSPIRFSWHAELARAIGAGGPDGTALRWGGRLRLWDALSLRVGAVDDFRVSDLVSGAGLELPVHGAWRAGVDLAFEPRRFELIEGEDAVIWGLRLSGPLPGSEEDEIGEELDEMLDRLDDWWDENPETVPSASPAASKGRP